MKTRSIPVAALILGLLMGRPVLTYPAPVPPAVPEIPALAAPSAGDRELLGPLPRFLALEEPFAAPVPEMFEELPLSLDPSGPAAPVGIPTVLQHASREEPEDGPSLRPGSELWLEFDRSNRRSVADDFLEALMAGPEALIDGAAELVSGLRTRPTGPVAADEGPLCLRMMDFRSTSPGGRGLFDEFIETLFHREQRFLASLAQNDLDRFSDEDPVQEIDSRFLLSKQRKILWDTLRRTYTSRHGLDVDRRIRDDAMQYESWSGLDYVVLPPLVAGYVYYRGIDKRISIESTHLTVAFMPVAELLHEEDLLGALTLDWRPRSFPLGLIVSVDLRGGDAELGFIGIGTSIDAALRAVLFQSAEREIPRE